MSHQPTSCTAWHEILPHGRPFLKMHGLRNHFIVVDSRNEPWRPAADEIVRLCDPRAGIGAEQIVVVERPSPAGEKEGAAAFARFWNVDGREAEACGNATRCVAWLLLQEKAADEVLLETRVGVLHARRVGPHRVRTGMGRISTAWREIPLAEQRDPVHLEFRCGPLNDPVALSIGNPHLVFFVEDLDDVDLETLAPRIQRDPLFPQQVNVGIAELCRASHLRLKVYERGAGLTMACGSGACAAAFAAMVRGLTDSRSMTVELPGGELEVEILPDDSAVMTGPVDLCFRGFLPPN